MLKEKPSADKGYFVSSVRENFILQKLRETNAHSANLSPEAVQYIIQYIAALDASQGKLTGRILTLRAAAEENGIPADDLHRLEKIGDQLYALWQKVIAPYRYYIE